MWLPQQHTRMRRPRVGAHTCFGVLGCFVWRRVQLTDPPTRHHPRNLLRIVKPAYSDCKTLASNEEGFSISQFSFGTIGVTVGFTMLVYGFGAFFNYLPGQSGSAPLLIYGFIISLLGSALKV